MSNTGLRLAKTQNSSSRGALEPHAKRPVGAVHPGVGVVGTLARKNKSRLNVSHKAQVPLGQQMEFHMTTDVDSSGVVGPRFDVAREAIIALLDARDFMGYQLRATGANCR